MTDSEAKVGLLKIICEFEAAGLSFVSLLEGCSEPEEVTACPQGEDPGRRSFERNGGRSSTVAV